MITEYEGQFQYVKLSLFSFGKEELKMKEETIIFIDEETLTEEEINNPSEKED